MQSQKFIQRHKCVANRIAICMNVLIGLVVFMLTVSSDQACVINGKVYGDGDTWIENNFVLECDERNDGSWRTRITACLAPGGFRLLVGTEFIEAGWRYTFVDMPYCNFIYCIIEFKLDQ
ncbi:unnamed protein product [Litomosoides sigmodontis]|uniref:Abnormal cell migration protein 18-like fibronectin type I domain-containing protein n=1 Tax=Litomosoides sigmodontis TaxID=42156 RepID=A0A3P6T0M2_LITSI|nr:unnamed protein product [Litomosoides sigmodontis]